MMWSAMMRPQQPLLHYLKTHRSIWHLHNDNLKSGDEEAVDATRDDTDDLNTSNENAIDSISDDPWGVQVLDI